MFDQYINNITERLDKNSIDFIKICLNVYLKEIKTILKNNSMDYLKKKLIFFFDKIELNNEFKINFDLEEIRIFLNFERKIDCIPIVLLLECICKTIIDETLKNTIKYAITKNDIANAILLNDNLNFINRYIEKLKE